MINCAVHSLNPCISKKASLISHTDYQGFNPRVCRFGNTHIWQTKVRLTAFETKLTKAPFTAPMRNTVGRLGSQLV